MKIIHIFGENAIRVADLIMPDGAWGEDKIYGFEIKSYSFPPMNSFESDCSNIIDETIAICSKTENTGAILCLKRFLNAKNISCEIVHLKSTDVV